MSLRSTRRNRKLSRRLWISEWRFKSLRGNVSLLPPNRMRFPNGSCCHPLLDSYEDAAS